MAAVRFNLEITKIWQNNCSFQWHHFSVKRTQVLDDESDYFTTEGNAWLSDKERQKLKQRQEELHKARHTSRLDRKFTLDFAGRRVIQDEGLTDIYDVNDEVVQEVHYGKKKTEKTGFQLKSNEFFDLSIINPTVEEPPKVSCEKWAVWRKIFGLLFYKFNPIWGKQPLDFSGGLAKLEPITFTEICSLRSNWQYGTFGCTCLVPSHYLKQCWYVVLAHICITGPQWVKHHTV